MTMGTGSTINSGLGAAAKLRLLGTETLTETFTITQSSAVGDYTSSYSSVNIPGGTKLIICEWSFSYWRTSDATGSGGVDRTTISIKSLGPNDFGVTPDDSEAQWNLLRNGTVKTFQIIDTLISTFTPDCVVGVRKAGLGDSGCPSMSVTISNVKFYG